MNARPLKRGHVQPKIPLSGHYRLDNPSVIEDQFQRAKSSGVSAFVFYHYWSNGDRPLGIPLERIIANKQIDVRFSLCWANHPWTRSWRNRIGSLDVLMPQLYERDSKNREKHFYYLMQAFADQRYVRIEGRPLFQIYIPEDITDLGLYLSELREYAYKHIGSELHLSASIRNWRASYDYLKYFDSATLAQPTLGIFSRENIFSDDQGHQGVREFALGLSPKWKKLVYRIQDMLPDSPRFIDYDSVWRQILAQSELAVVNSPVPVNLGGFVDFDNTPRYGRRARVMEGFSPEKFSRYISRLLTISEKGSNVIFINAWNEWGEGMYLEDDEQYGGQRLSELRKVLCC